MKKFMGDFGTVINDIDLSLFGTRTGDRATSTLTIKPAYTDFSRTGEVDTARIALSKEGSIAVDDTALRLSTDHIAERKSGDFNDIFTNIVSDPNNWAASTIQVEPVIQTMVSESDSVIDKENIVGESPNGNIVVASIKDGVLNMVEIKTDDSKVFKGKVKKGQKSKMVKIVKKFLKNKNLYLGIVDENFGSELAQVLREFQLSKGIEVTGEIDADTFNIVVGADAELANANKLTQLNQAKKSKSNKMAMGVAGLALLFFANKG